MAPEENPCPQCRHLEEWCYRVDCPYPYLSSEIADKMSRSDRMWLALFSACLIVALGVAVMSFWVPFDPS